MYFIAWFETDSIEHDFVLNKKICVANQESL